MNVGNRQGYSTLSKAAAPSVDEFRRRLPRLNRILPSAPVRLMLAVALLGPLLFADRARGADFHEFVHNGHTIDYALVLPDRFDKTKPYSVLLALPPGDQSRQLVEAGLNLYWEAEAKRRGWVVISPAAPEGESFYTGLDKELPSLLDEVAKFVLFEGGKAHLAGVSNGGLSAYRVITEFPGRFLSLTVLPGIPPDARASPRSTACKGFRSRRSLAVRTPSGCAAAARLSKSWTAWAFRTPSPSCRARAT
jgi:poly(3-hydroxybutyrate) depolymerase